MTTPADSAGRIGPAGYLRRRFPLHSIGAAILGCHVAAVALYESAAPGGAAFRPALICGAVAVVLLFLHLRLVDDLDDVVHDVPAAQVGAVRRRLVRFLVGTDVVIVALAAAWPPALVAAVAAMAVSLLTPLFLTRLFRENRVLLAPCYEGAPLLVFWFGYLQWAGVSGQALPVPVAAGVVVAFWSAYEFWKFTRKVGQDAFQPYALGDTGLRRGVVGLLAVAAVADLVVAVAADLSWFFIAYGVLVPGGLGGWALRRWPRRGGPAPAWRGLTLAASLVVAVLVESLLAAAGLSGPWLSEIGVHG